MMVEKADKIFIQLFVEAECLFGESNSDWTYGGIEFYDQPPHLRYYPDSGHVTIALSLKAIDDDIQFIFQLSHEICHLLHPSIDYPSLYLNKTLVINEGISTYFSILKTDEKYNIKAFLIENLKIHSHNYYQAYLAVEELINLDSKAIKKLRASKQKIDTISGEDFNKLQVKIPKTLQEKLLKEFK